MAWLEAPLPNVKYRIRNVDFGTFMERRNDDAGDTVVLRPQKDNDLQHWVFDKVTTSDDDVVYRIKAPACGDDDKSVLTVNLDGHDDNLSIAFTRPSKKYIYEWSFNQSKLIEPCTYIFVDPSGPALLTVDASGMSVRATHHKDIKSEKSFSRRTLDDAYKWELLEVSPSSLPDGGNQNYRIRTLNGQALQLDPSGKVSVESRDQGGSHRAWTIEANPGNGFCTIHNVQAKKYLTARDKGDLRWDIISSDLPAVWTLSKKTLYGTVALV